MVLQISDYLLAISCLLATAQVRQVSGVVRVVELCACQGLIRTLVLPEFATQIVVYYTQIYRYARLNPFIFAKLIIVLYCLE